jgi:hypothetical protein
LRQVVIPVDQHEFNKGVVERALASSDLQLPLRVQIACNGPKRLRDVRQLLQKADFHPKAASTPYASYLDAAHGQVVLSFEQAGSTSHGVVPEALRAAEEVAGSAKARFGGLVRIETGRPARTSRASDAQPHYGAAAIGSSGNMFCTSGPIMYTGGGASKGALTAGHCFNNGDSVFSGLNGYGLAGGKSGFPTYDMMSYRSERADVLLQLLYGPGLTNQPHANAQD